MRDRRSCAPRHDLSSPAVALDRPFIEKRDFPVRRRGYDTDAVAAHLATLADRFDALQRPPRPESLAGAASDRVRVIVEAAERSAAELGQEAEEERGRILDASHREANQHLERVVESTASLLGRVALLEKELGDLLDFVRSSATRLTGELKALEGAVDEFRNSPPPPDPEIAPVPSPPGDEGARLIALNMALSGTPREETERYLAENFEAMDVNSLLDDVYVRAGQ